MAAPGWFTLRRSGVAVNDTGLVIEMGRVRRLRIAADDPDGLGEAIVGGDRA